MEKDKIYGYVYLITNQINGKVYVGQTTYTPQKRFQAHCQQNHKKDYMVVVRAIKKYGKENFTVETLAECSNGIDLDKCEVFYISAYGSKNREFGYNVDSGGGSGTPKNDEIKLKFSIHNHMKPPHKCNKTGYKGVCKSSDGYGWQSSYKRTIDGIKKCSHIGRFKTAEEAAKAYDDKMFELYGLESYFNFPDRIYKANVGEYDE
jgi:group I intron endonuclease